uniref:Uncharacterized protein n=1 Tax=Arundo donax TaxID=35708 RepID=A0A0A9FZ78_ARUDO
MQLAASSVLQTTASISSLPRYIASILLTLLSATVPRRATIPTTSPMKCSPLEHRTKAAVPIFSIILCRVNSFA